MAVADAFHRTDAVEKVTGRATYGVDLVAPRMLVGGVLRARVQRGAIRTLDTSAAEAMDGVVVATAADFPGGRFGMLVHDQPPLADGDVRHAGEAMVAVAAPDARTLRLALERIVEVVEPAPAVSDVEAALEPDSPLVHPQLLDYDVAGPVHLDGNVCGRATVERGEVDDVFDGAAHVFEHRYSSARVHQGYIEPRACLATAVPGGFEVITSTQNPQGVRTALAQIFELPVSAIRVRAATVGGGFGGKIDVTLEHLACVLARKARRPVKFVSSRHDEFVSSFPRENSVVHIRSALDDDGRILARDVRCLMDAGAYARDTPHISGVASLLATGPYRIDNVRVEVLTVYTNTQPTGAYRGPSGPQMVLAVEAHLDEIAGALGIDAIDLRRRNLLREGDTALNGQEVDHVTIGACLERAVEAIDLAAPRPANRGVGLACAWWPTTAHSGAATIGVDTDGTVTVQTGATEIGSGAVASGIVHLAAEALGVAPERVRVAESGSTSAGAFDNGAQGSRTTFDVGNAVLEACGQVRQQLLQQASAMLERLPDELRLEGGVVCSALDPDVRVPLGQVAAAALTAGGPIHASARTAAPAPKHDPDTLSQGHLYPTFLAPSFHCHAVEVEVDPDTGVVDLLRYVAVQDVGRAVVPPAIEGQIHGGVVQGIGMALYEEERLIDGHVVNASLDGYKIPTAVEAPDVVCILVEEGSATGPHGAKGVGEPPIILPAAAIANAIAAATGRRIRDLPMTPERIVGGTRPTGEGRGRAVSRG